MKRSNARKHGSTSWRIRSLTLLICLIGIAATSGCATPPTVPDIELPEIRQDLAIARAAPLCKWPDPIELEQDGNLYIAFDVPAFQQILICQETELANHEVAEANADTAEAYRDIAQGMVDYLPMLVDLANYKLAREHAEAQDNRLEATAWKGVAALLAIAGAL